MEAGASKPFGYPLTADILPEIRKRLGTGKLFGHSKKKLAAERRLQHHFSRMLPGWKRCAIATPPITDVLSLLDYSSISQTAPLLDTSTAELLRFRRLLEWAIYRIIELSYAGKQTEDLKRFISYLLACSNPIGIITTNYDTEVESALFEEFSDRNIETKFDFGFDWRETSGKVDRIYCRPPNPRFRFYKLHGSINWLRCDICEHTYINVVEPIGFRAFDETKIDFNSCHCGHFPLNLVLTAPSLVRDVRNVDLLSSWQAALEWLRSASEWIIIGYSFPQEDLAIRSMFIRAYQARSGKNPPKITVVQKGGTKEIKDRYKILFPDCGWIDTGIEGFLEKHEKKSMRSTAARKTKS